jgi:uncharacterized protein YcbX
MPTVSALRIYPVKSLRGVDLDQSEVHARGLQHDRRWMIIDDDGIFLTQRSFTKMATISAVPNKTALHLTTATLPDLAVPYNEGQNTRAKVWSKWVTAKHVSAEADAWLSRALARPCRLVYMPDTAKRRPSTDSTALVGFADSHPILIASEESLQDLNDRLPTPIEINRFRPNIVLKGCTPFQEDTFKRLRIGATILRAAKKCNRCQVTTTDQLTGELKGPEPLKTLATYRRNGNGVAFGMYYIPEMLGQIKVGDRVEVLE